MRRSHGDWASRVTVLELGLGCEREAFMQPRLSVQWIETVMIPWLDGYMIT